MKSPKDVNKLINDFNKNEKNPLTRDSLNNKKNNINEFTSFMEQAAIRYTEAINPFNLDPFITLDNSLTTIQKTLGTTKDRLGEFKIVISDVIPDLIRMGLSYEQAFSETIEIMKGLGSVASLSTEAILEVSAAALVGGQNTRVLAQSFREVGVSIYDVGERMKEVNDIAKNAGVSVTAVSELVVSNLKQMNLYNFDTGVKGLSQMAVTSERLGVSMNRVFDFAEKIFNPEGAIEMSAGLQRLGVTASGLLDPLRAMDLAMNDPKGLQDEILNITKEFTRFNEVNGNFEIMPGSKRRLREIAKEMGIPAEELAQMSIKAADFDRKMQQITFPSLATDQETKEMIAGMAQLKDGKAMINVRNETTGKVELKRVEELTAKDIETLKKSQADSSKSIEQVALDQLSVLEQIRNNTDATIRGTELGRVTAGPMDRLYTGLFDVGKDLTENIYKTIGQTENVRGVTEDISGPLEKFVIGFIQDDLKKQDEASYEFKQNLLDLSGKFTITAESFLSDTNSRMVEIVQKTYENQLNVVPPQQTISTKSDVNVQFNVKTSGVDGVNEFQIQKILNEYFMSEEGKNFIRNTIANSNAPSSVQSR
jgi:hypothetical protein